MPHIVNRGAAWFRGLAHGEDGGTKIYGASGRVKRPGAWELPMGTTVREILEEHAGGMREGYALRALLPGGASTRSSPRSISTSPWISAPSRRPAAGSARAR